MTYQDTSRQALDSIQGEVSGDIDTKIINSLKPRGAQGRTCWEIEMETGLPHQSSSGNLRHLVERGIVCKTNLRRTNAGGRKCIVWVHKDFYDPHLHGQQPERKVVPNLRVMSEGALPCRFVVDDWRKSGEAASVYETELGVELAQGDLHSGSTFRVVLKASHDLLDELREAMQQHGAYAVFRVIPDVELVAAETKDDPKSQLKLFAGA